MKFPSFKVFYYYITNYEENKKAYVPKKRKIPAYFCTLSASVNDKLLLILPYLCKANVFVAFLIIIFTI